MSVAMKPRVTTFTVTPIPSPTGRFARFSWKIASLASDFVRPNRPDLDAA
jgi:hypothetical protein